MRFFFQNIIAVFSKVYGVYSTPCSSVTSRQSFRQVSIFFLIMKTGKKVGVDADRNEVDGPAEKDLDLPARSRFGEGRAEPLIDLIRGPSGQRKGPFP